MTCPLDRGRLTAYVDGELTPDEFNSIREHLRTCPDCRVAAEHEERAKRLLRAKFASAPAPAGLREKILRGLDSIDAESNPARVHPLYRQRTFIMNYKMLHLISAAAAVVILLGGGLYYNLTSQAAWENQFAVESPEANVARVQTASWGDFPLSVDGDGNIVLTGKLVCIGCEFSHKYHIYVDCKKHGHHFVLLTDFGLYVDFTPNDRSTHLLHEQQLAGLKVKIIGKLCTKSNYMDIVNYEKLPV